MDFVLATFKNSLLTLRSTATLSHLSKNLRSVLRASLSQLCLET